MEIPKLKFTKLWTNHDDFPTVETREEVVRSDMQLLFNEIRDYLNTTLSGVVSTIGDTLTALQGKTGAGRIGFTKTAAIDQENVQDAIECVQAQLVNVSQGGIADGAVTAQKLADGAIGTAAIADAAVTYDKIKDKAVGSAKLADNAVSERKIATNAVQERQIFDGSVTEGKIGYGAVTANKISDGAVGSSKIANGAVMGDAIADGAITGSKVPYKALRTVVDISASVTSQGGVCTSDGGLFEHAHAIGLMFFTLTLRELAADDVGKNVTISFSGGEAYQRPGTSVGPDNALRDLNMSSLTAQIVYRDGEQNIARADAIAYFAPSGQLVVQIPNSVVAGRNCEITVSGWYSA